MKNFKRAKKLPEHMIYTRKTSINDTEEEKIDAYLLIACFDNSFAI
jgi:hypothetical protein